MHEMGIASSILEAADAAAARYPGCSTAKIGVVKINVVIGEYAGVDTESLRFCFEVLARERTPAPELAIDWRIGTDELKLAYLEMEEVSHGQSDPREESPERERSNRGAAA
jgi:Zn finger protein HypA/HybF involved in hydrogenase expression